MKHRPTPLFIRPARFALGGACLLVAVAAFAADTPAWIARSNANSQVLLDATNRFQPEGASQTGFPEFDGQVADLKPGVNERYVASETAARDELAKRLLAETDPLVKQDLEILIKAADDDIATRLLRNKLLLAYVDVGQLIYFGEFGLLQDQVDPARRPAALKRLRLYTGLEPGSTPMTQLAMDRYNEQAADPQRLGAFKDRIQQSIANSDRYVQGIHGLFTQYGLDQQPGGAEALARLDQQLKDYAGWLQTTVLPRARADYRLPAEIYADNLKNVGLDIPPEQLVAQAMLAFTEIRNEMQSLAPLVAREHGFADPDYRAVIRELKRDQLPKDQVEPYYHEVIGKIEDLIRREGVVTLPERPMIMRLASEAENAAQPAPHMQPPPLVNNKGERGQFILTTGNPPAAAGAKTTGYDDFTLKAAAWTLTAHEGRPGHELQFSAMVERGVSLARSLFAFNSVNVEGWALYAEAEMKPYEPLDGQLVTLQLRLMRAARAFIDPMLNLGQMTPQRAHEILTQDVGLSEPMAQQEVDRYTFRSPGQATAYFYGYTKILELRTATEVALGAKFDRHAFNDFLIGQGLLPPDLLAKAVREQFIPAAARRE
ncbi:MAG TPA: DUF885 domain-containing protein [Lacunisphaera sp.]|nr:DUF885 domain-containing protein [Lacunisphaera sp.]